MLALTAAWGRIVALHADGVALQLDCKSGAAKLELAALCSPWNMWRTPDGYAGSSLVPARAQLRPRRVHTVVGTRGHAGYPNAVSSVSACEQRHAVQIRTAACPLLVLLFILSAVNKNMEVYYYIIWWELG